MSFRNAVILSFCLAAGMAALSGCAYNDKYVEIVLVDSGKEPAGLPSQNRSPIPADIGNAADSVYAQDNGAYDSAGKEEKKPQEPKESPRPSATPDTTLAPMPTATPMPTPAITPEPTPAPTPKPTPAATRPPQPVNTPQPTSDIRCEEELTSENSEHDERVDEINQRHGKDMDEARRYLNILLEEPSDEQEYYDTLEQVKSGLAEAQANLDAELAREEARHEQAVKNIKAKYGKQ